MTPTVAPASGALLTDEMLARFADARAQVPIARTRFSPRTSRSFDRPVISRSRCLPSWAAVGCRSQTPCASNAGWALSRPRPRSRSTCTSTGPAWRLTCTVRAIDSLAWILEETMRGAVFAAGHAESGNDIPVLLSTTKAERVEGGYRFTGRKSFGSLSPVWTYLGHARHGHERSRTPEDRARVHAARYRGIPRRTHVGRPGHACDAERRHDPRRRLRRRSPHREGRTGRRRRHRSLRPRGVRVGAHGLRKHLLRPRAPRVRHDARSPSNPGARLPCHGRWRITPSSSTRSPR